MRKFFSFSANLILFGLVLLTIALRIPLLTGSFWLDEAAQALESARPLSEQLQIQDDFQPPLLHLILHFALYFGDSEWWLRTVGAMIPAVVTVLLTYKIGKKLCDEKTGLIAGALLATSAFHIFYSQELRQYSLPAAWATISWYLLLSAWKDKRSYLKQELILFALVSLAGLYSSYLYPFLLISQLVWLIGEKRGQFKIWLLTAVVVGVLFLPWLPSFLGQLSAGQALQTSLPGWSVVVSPTQFKAIPLLIAKFLYGPVDVNLTPPFFALTFVILGVAGYLTFRLGQNRSTISNLKPLLYWLCVSIITAWFISFFVPVLQAKRVLFSLPAMYLFLAALIFYAKKQQLFQKLSYILVILVLFINLFSVYSYWTKPQLQRENWKDLISQIQTQFPDNSVVVFSFSAPFAPWRWYADPNYPVVATQEYSLTKQTAEATVQQLLEYDHVLVFDYLRDLTDPDHLLDQYLLEAGYKTSGYLDYPQIGFVRIYSKPAAVISYQYGLRKLD